MKQSVVAYCRVSTSSKDQENSFENQKNFFEREVGRSETLELVGIYADKGITGTSLNKRDDFTRMLLDAGLIERKVTRTRSIFEIDHSKKPKFNMILVKNTSRFARNVMVIDILRELVKNKVYVKFLDIDLLFDSLDKEFMLNLFLNFDQQDSIDKSKKVRFGLKESARQGRIFGASKLYGYRYDDETNELFIIDSEAKIIKYIYKLYIKGFGIRKIIKELDKNGYKTRSNKSFSISMIRRILSNEKYYGTLVRNKYDAGQVFNKRSYSIIKPEEEWIITENRIPAIISKELFDIAKELRLGKKHHINQKGIYKGITEYAGLIYCGNCGLVYTSNSDDGRKFYNCKTKKSKGVDICSNPNINHKTIDMVLEGLQNGGYYEMFIKDRESRVEGLIKQKNDLLLSIDQQDIDAARELSKELDELHKKKKRLLTLYLDGAFEKDMLDQESSKIDSSITLVESQIKATSSTNEEIMEQIAEIEESIEKINSQEIKQVYEKEEVLSMIDRFIIRKDEQGKPLVDIRFDGDSDFRQEGEQIEINTRHYK